MRGGGHWNNTQGPSLCLQVEVVVGGGVLEQHTGPQSLFAGGGCCGGGGGVLEQHTGLQSLFAGGGCCGGGFWNNTRGSSLCLQVGVVVAGGPGTTHEAPVFVCRWRLLWGGGPETTNGAPVFVCRWRLLWGGGLKQHTGLQSLFA